MAWRRSILNRLNDTSPTLTEGGFFNRVDVELDADIGFGNGSVASTLRASGRGAKGMRQTSSRATEAARQETVVLP